jgi:hypothetical protein
MIHEWLHFPQPVYIFNCFVLWIGACLQILHIFAGIERAVPPLPENLIPLKMASLLPMQQLPLQLLLSPHKKEVFPDKTARVVCKSIYISVLL